jgi:ethanolamine utilization protein EutQ (cupin superfamily)
MNVPGVNAYFEDIVGSSDANAPLSCGLFKIEKGKPLVYTYDYDDSKIILEGHIFFSDGTKKVKGEPGDVLFFPKGSTITFSTDKTGLAYACGQRKLF